jgi:hypothetical protein
LFTTKSPFKLLSRCAGTVGNGASVGAAAFRLSRGLGSWRGRKGPGRKRRRKPVILANFFRALVTSVGGSSLDNLRKSLREIIEVSTKTPLNGAAHQSLGNAALESLNIRVVRPIDFLHPFPVDADTQAAHGPASLFPVAVFPVAGPHDVVQALHHGAGVDVGQHLAPDLTGLRLAVPADPPLDVFGGERGSEPFQVLVRSHGH